MYNAIDINKDGQLEKSELTQLIQDAFNNDQTEQVVDNIFKIFDHQNSGYIDDNVFKIMTFKFSPWNFHDFKHFQNKIKKVKFDNNAMTTLDDLISSLEIDDVDIIEKMN